MRVILCVCGERLDSSDDELFGVIRAHVDVVHPDWNIPDDRLRTALEDWSGNEPWDGARREVSGSVEVKPLSIDTLDDFLAFFDRRAFMENPFWFGCYCIEPHQGDSDRTPSENREDKIGLVKEGAARGFLAYVDGEPVGWCNAAARSTLPGVLEGILEGTDADADEPVGSIACFTIAAPWRGSGVGRTLLGAACDALKAQGLPVAEAYPRKGDLSEARSYRGPLQMYESAGFERHGETEGHLIVRKRL
jgi:GNAT superfamily N-acetyltransferase